MIVTKICQGLEEFFEKSSNNLETVVEDLQRSFEALFKVFSKIF